MRQTAVIRVLGRHRLPALVIVLVAVLTGLSVGVLLNERGSTALAPSIEALASATQPTDPSGTAGTSPAGGSPPPTIEASVLPLVEATASPRLSPATPTQAPSASAPAAHVGFEDGDILRVEVNGLAVRQGPSVSSQLTQGARVAAGPALEPMGDVRLAAGELVSVHLGPLLIGDTAWYVVWPAERYGHGSNDTYMWTSPDSGESSSSPGWVAASVDQDQYLTLHRRPTTDVASEGHGTLMVAGSGNYESGPQGRNPFFALTWAVATEDRSAPCAFSMTLSPEGGAADAVVALEVSTADIAQGPTGTDGPFMQGAWVMGTVDWGTEGAWDTFTVSISSGCTWAVRLEPLGYS
jgi:hypothetical protein